MEALAGVVIGGLIGIGGTIASVLLGQRFERARWKVQRREEAYVEFSQWLSVMWAWARSYHPFMGPIDVVEQPKGAEHMRVEALVTLHASKQVDVLLDKYNVALVEVMNCGSAIEGDRDTEEGNRASSDAWKKMPAAKEALWQATESLRKQMASELA